MRIGTACRITRDVVHGSGLRERTWTARQIYRHAKLLRQPWNQPFALEVARSYRRFILDGVKPVLGETRARARLAVEWLVRAQEATRDDGVSFGYFPCHRPDVSAWQHSYPETTGYIIVSLLEYADYYGDAVVREHALRMARWELDVQMPSGAVQAGPVCPLDQRMPAVFNTGVVLQGYVSVLGRTQSDDVLRAARRAADFLVADMGTDGHFRTHGPYVTPARVKTYNCLCAWPLYRLGEYLGDDDYRRAALRAADAALGEQQPNGWFANNCLNRPEAPLLHTIGYTLQGILEVGLLAKSERLVSAARRGIDPLLARVACDGFLHGRFYADWEPATWSACLTGQAQLAVVAYRLFEASGHPIYLERADDLVNFLKPLQCRGSRDPALNGPLPGSFPILGTYMPGGYPSWATKYFLDALMLQDRLSNG